MQKIRLISRNSRLAVIQSQEVMSKVQGQQFVLKFIESFGDKNKNIFLSENKMVDFFTKELDQALLNDEVDIAVHSAKDIPYPLPDGLEVIALTACLSSSDVLVSKGKKKLAELPVGSKIGTSSAERKRQLLALRPDLVPEEIRGTIDERLALVDSGKIQALVVAGCALQRLGYEHLIAETLPFETHPLQGHLAVVAKKGNVKLKSLFYELDIRKNYGKVSIGPFLKNHPEYLTLKALNELHLADIIYYDESVNPEFVRGFTAEKTFFSKDDDFHIHLKNIFMAARYGKKVFCLTDSEACEQRASVLHDYLSERLIYNEILPGIGTSYKDIVFESLPEKRKRSKVLVTSQNQQVYDHIGDVVYYPFSEFKASSNMKLIQSAVSSEKKYDFVVFETKESVSFFNKTLSEQQLDLRWLAPSKLIAVGNIVVSELLKFGLRPDIIVKDNSSVIDFFVEHQLSGRKVLILKPVSAGDTASTLLRRMGYEITALALYENVDTHYEHIINLDDIDIVAFSTPLSVSRFKTLYHKLPEHISIISDGDDTRRSLYDTGLLHYEPEWVI